MDDFQLSNEIQPPDFRGSGSGKAFEKILIERMNDEEDQGNATMSRYGVQASYTKMGLIAMQSLLTSRASPRAVASSSLTQRSRPAHRSIWGLTGTPRRVQKLGSYATCCSGLTSVSPAPFSFTGTAARPSRFQSQLPTYWVHIDGRTRFWQSVLRGETKTIKRKDCEDIGYKVRWTLKKGQRKPRPDVLSTILEITGEERS